MREVEQALVGAICVATETKPVLAKDLAACKNFVDGGSFDMDLAARAIRRSLRGRLLLG